MCVNHTSPDGDKKGFGPKTLSAMPGLLGCASVQTHPSTREEHGMSCSVFHWKIPVELFCTKLMFLSNFSLHFFETDASTKLVCLFF